MPANKRPRRERTDDWQKIQHYTLWPEQKAYELLRPVVLFNEPTVERAMETSTAQRSMYPKVAQFEEQGMGSLFAKEESGRERDTSRSLPPDMRQLIVDLKAEHPGFRLNGNCHDLLSPLWPKTFASHGSTGLSRWSRPLNYDPSFSSIW